MKSNSKNKNNKNGSDILKVKKSDQYRTVDELMERSQPNSAYYTLLVLSSFIVASGLLLNNSAIVIGGMLVTPMLTPILVMGLGLSTGEIDFVKKEGLFVFRSLVAVIASALVLALIFGSVDQPFVFDDSLRTAVLYFIVAFASGIAATFAWMRRETAEILPGIAIAVSLMPPLAIIGIGLSAFDLSLVRPHLFIFLFNLVGVVVGSFGVFSMLKFYKTEERVHQKGKELK